MKRIMLLIATNLAIVLVLVAVMTWLLSRYWVFRGSSANA